jgi:hypothetical protein
MNIFRLPPWQLFLTRIFLETSNFGENRASHAEAAHAKD